MGIQQALEKEPDPWDLGAIRMIVGGSAAPESMIRGFDRHGLRVIHAWGMTETTPLGTVSWLKRSLEGLPEDERYAYRATQVFKITHAGALRRLDLLATSAGPAAVGLLNTPSHLR